MFWVVFCLFCKGNPKNITQFPRPHGASTSNWVMLWGDSGGCCAPLHEECPQHHGHKGDPGVTPMTCGVIGERAQVILVWVRAPGVENASHPIKNTIMCLSSSNGVELIQSLQRQLWLTPKITQSDSKSVYSKPVIRATSHTSQEPWPWNCESPKESVQRLSQDTSKIM